MRLPLSRVLHLGDVFEQFCRGRSVLFEQTHDGRSRIVERDRHQEEVEAREVALEPCLGGADEVSQGRGADLLDALGESGTDDGQVNAAVADLGQ